MQRSNRQSVYRKAGVIHANRYRSGIIRNLSETGALIDGIDALPTGTSILVDLGEGQLTFARVVRGRARQLGVRFELPLVDDGSGTLCTPKRISAYNMATLGLPKPGEPDRTLRGPEQADWTHKLAERLGINPPLALDEARVARGSHLPATFRDLSRDYLESLTGDEHALQAAEQALTQHFLPRFGQRSADHAGWDDVGAFLSSLDPSASPGLGLEEVQQLRKLTSRMWALACDLKLVNANQVPKGGEQIFGRRGQGYSPISAEEAHQLLLAARTSPNRQLKYIMALLMLTGARSSEILGMRWTDLDLGTGDWRIKLPGGGRERLLRLGTAAVALLSELPKLGDCPYVLPNLSTRKPYRSLTQSWEVVKARADLGHLELDDLRDCSFGEALWLERLQSLLTASEEG